jgi:phosphate transport system substrate-binding protein
MKKGVLRNLLFTAVVLCLCLGIAHAEELTIVGTGAGASVLEKVGKAFTAKNPDITIVVPPSIGSGGGVKAVGNDENVLGRVSRKIKDKEKNLELTYAAYAKLPIVFYVNSTVGVKNLTSGQIADIYSGKITNWQEVGGSDGKIRVIRREDGDSSLKVLLNTVPGFKDIELTKKSKTTYSDPETLDTCEKTPGSIAFGAYSDVKDNKNITALSLDGVKASSANYAHVGELGLIYKEKNNTGNVRTFIEFITSGAANDVLADAGAIPVK